MPFGNVGRNISCVFEHRTIDVSGEEEYNKSFQENSCLLKRVMYHAVAWLTFDFWPCASHNLTHQRS